MPLDSEDFVFPREGESVTEWQAEAAPNDQKSRMEVLLREWKGEDKALTNVKKIVVLFQFSQENPLLMNEMPAIDEMFQPLPDNVEVLWGAGFDNNLCEKIRLTAVWQ